MARLSVRFKSRSASPFGPTAPLAHGPPWPGSTTTWGPSIGSPPATIAVAAHGVRTTNPPRARPTTTTGTPVEVTNAAGCRPVSGQSGAGSGVVTSQRPAAASAGTNRRCANTRDPQRRSLSRHCTPTSTRPSPWRRANTPTTAPGTATGALASQRPAAASAGTNRRCANTRDPQRPSPSRHCTPTSTRPSPWRRAATRTSSPSPVRACWPPAAPGETPITTAASTATAVTERAVAPNHPIGDRVAPRTAILLHAAARLRPLTPGPEQYPHQSRRETRRGAKLGCSVDGFLVGESHWVCWRLGLLVSNQCTVGLSGSVGLFELRRR